MKTYILPKILKRVNIIFFIFVYYKIFLFFFYGISGYQNFTPRSVTIILRAIITNDLLLFFFSILNSITCLFHFKRKRVKILLIAFSLLNALFALVTLFSAAFIVVISE